MKVFRKTAFLFFAAGILLFGIGCGDQYRPVANPINGPGGQPQLTHSAYVINYNPLGASSSVLIDVSGDTVLNSQPVGMGSKFEATTPNGSLLFVANSLDDTVSEYPLFVTSTTTTINLLPGSHPVALVSTDASNMYVLNSAANSACPTTGSISTINTSTLAVQNTVCVGLNPIAMVQQPAAGKIYIVNQGDNSISVFAPSTQTVTKVITGAQNLGVNPTALSMSLDGKWVFVAAQGTPGGPGVLDTIATSLDVIAGVQPLGVAPTSTYIDSKLNRLYVTNTGDNTVSVFDSSNVVLSNNPPVPLLAQVAVGVAPASVTALANGTRFYVANSGDNTVSVVSASSFVVQTTVAVGVTPTFLASDPTSSKVYVVNQAALSTSIIQTSNNVVVGTVASPQQDPNCIGACPLQTPVMVITE